MSVIRAGMHLLVRAGFQPQPMGLLAASTQARVLESLATGTPSHSLDPLTSHMSTQSATPATADATAPATSNQATTSTAAPTTNSSTTVPDNQPDSPWVEVVHEATGQTYYWNQRTGQTTALGDPRPQGGRHSSGGGGAGGSAGNSQGGEETIDPRAETPLPDRTGHYAAVGALLGVFLGWASQFF